jgi:phosphotriesterase-related protein
MMTGSLSGKVQTVLGPIEPALLGVTSSHEHVLSDMSPYLLVPEGASERGLVDQPLSLEILAWARAHRFSNLDNMRLNDRELASAEVSRFKCAGGSTIVEMSSVGMCRDPEGLAYVARATGVNIIMGSGYYLGISHPPELCALTEEEIAANIAGDILSGVGDTGVKAGIVGEIGCAVPLSGNEQKVLKAAAIAQRHTGAPMDVHPSFSDELALQIVDILQEAGAVLTHTMISHMDVFDYTLETRLKILDSGCYIGYDNFGNMGYPHPYLGKVVNLTSDFSRIKDIKDLIDRGYLDQILIGQDTVFKDQLRVYGGYGYAHLLENVLPLMHAMGITAEQTRALVVENPKRFLTFVEPG